MAKDDLAAHCLELLAPLGRVRARRMFGGHGLYVDDLFVAILGEQVLYLKVNDETAPRFEAAGGKPFTYTFKDGRVGRLAFYTPPAEALESPALMQPWGRLAVQAALQAANAPRKRAKAPASVAAKAKPAAAKRRRSGG